MVEIDINLVVQKKVEEILKGLPGKEAVSPRTMDALVKDAYNAFLKTDTCRKMLDQYIKEQVQSCIDGGDYDDDIYNAISPLIRKLVRAKFKEAPHE